MSEVHEQEDHQLEWGYENPALAAARIRDNVAVIGGLDVGKVLTGHILERILGDDSGVFGTAMLWFRLKNMQPEEAVIHKEVFLNRLRWEIEQQETPRAIKEMLTFYRGKLGETVWDKEENVKASRADWEEMVHSQVIKMVENNEEGAGDANREYRRYGDEASKRKLSL